MKKYAAHILVILAVVATLLLDRYIQEPALVSYDSLVATKAEADSVIRENGDSARERVKIVYVQQDRADALHATAKQLDSLAALAAERGTFEIAYHYAQSRGDSLERALTIQRRATENALAASAFRELQFMADSTRRSEEWRVTQRLARAVRPAWYKRCGVSAGWSIRGMGPDVMLGCKLWP